MIGKTTTTAPSRRRPAILVAATVLVALGLWIPAAAFAAPAIEVSSSHVPVARPIAAGTSAIYKVKLTNTGDEETATPVTVDFTVPPGFEIASVNDEINKQFQVPVWNCSIATDARSASCNGPEVYGEFMPTPAGAEACDREGLPCRILITVSADQSTAPGTVLHPAIHACGWGAASCVDAPDDPVEVGPMDFQVTKFDGKVTDPAGDPATQAGSHPHTAMTEFFWSTSIGRNEQQHSNEALKDAAVKLPAGLVGNPRAFATCTQQQLTAPVVQCPAESQMGIVKIWFDGFSGEPENPYPTTAPVYNMQVPFGLPALLAFNLLGNVTQIYGRLRADDDYRVELTAKNAPETLPFEGNTFELWGVPADPSHDAERRCAGSLSPGCDFSGPAKPFISLPTSCVGPVETFLEITSWLGGKAGSSFLSHDNTEPVPNPIGADGCNAVDFSPTLQARPTTNVADSPSGLDVNLHIPQNEDPDGTAEAHLKDTAVTLPPGLVVNPSGANGLDGCSTSEFGLATPVGTTPIRTDAEPAHCPDAAKLGTVVVDTPLLDNPLHGSVYIADPYKNPFGSLLALYVAVDDPQTSVVVKLAGKVTPDPATGQLSATFENNPQQPFEDFRLHFSGGAGGSLRTPAVCGQYTTSSSLTPWSAPDSGPPASPSDTWAISQAPGGGSCPTTDAARPNTPNLDAGTVSPIAGTYSPFVLSLSREDGSQQFSSVTVSPPPGLIGRLAGIAACPDSALAAAASKSGQQEKASPSCPAGSMVGTVTAGAGAGPAPYYAPGTAYLAGPYKGAPLSLAVITPATAGPFDLGTIVVRIALYIDPSSARITAVSDPIPSILKGIPLDVRSVQVKLDRPEFTRNPTNCNPLAFSGQLVSGLSQVAPLEERFQVGECSRLAFKPKLGIRLFGGTKRGDHPALRGVVQMPAGGANIAQASVALPHSEFLDQSHIGTVCTRVQFSADQCPAASVYGHAIASSPLVDYTVEGPVYLRSSSHKLPDLVMALHGPPSQPIEVDAVARIDSVKGGIRSTFEAVPDVPLTKVVLEMQGGKKGLLQNSTNTCKGKNLATAQFTAQNGGLASLKAQLKAKCGKAPRKKGGPKGGGGGHRAVR